MPTYLLKQVFTPGGMPSITYVARENIGLERSLIEAMDRGHAVITVSGQTKSGKTVLCRRVLGDRAVWMEGGRINGAAAFWEELTRLVDAPVETIDETSATRSQAKTASKAEVSLGIVKAGVEGSRETLAKTGRVARKYAGPSHTRLLHTLISRGRTLVVDDFHFIDKATQKAIVNALKQAVFDGLGVVIIAVPHRAFDPLAVQQEMQGRFIHIEVKPWAVNELVQIPKIGFEALNVEAADADLNTICTEALGSPLLVQDLCFRLCQLADIKETEPQRVKIVLGDNFDAVCEAVAQNSGFPVFDRLARGPQARKDRKTRLLRSGGSIDIYQAILLAIVESGANARTSYEDLRTAMRHILAEGEMPQKNEVTSACGHMSAIARGMENVEPVEWHDNALVISDPFLLFYMKWQRDQIWQRLTGHDGPTRD